MALRSVAVIDGIAELRFDASPKVPTITEEDVATAFRLASEEKRPEFVYIPIPPWHPFYGRQFKHYSPTWLRGTSLGELLSEADWNMKCLHVGAQSNKTKSAFWSWQKKSKLEGLATRLDFPEDNPPGSVFMSCESAKVEKNENEIAFPEEPKMRIVDDSSSLYTKYITEIYSSVAYHDEPLFLKMQELIKLILAAEWLTKKGVKISKEWMMKHTSRSDNTAVEESGCTAAHSETKEPPRMLIPPQPTEIRRPTSDVIVKTLEAEQYRSLAKCGIKQWYGWIDFGGKEMIWFNEDGVRCQQQQSVKMVVKQQTAIEGQPAFKMTSWESIPLPPDTPMPILASAEADRDATVTTEQLPIPPDSHEEITGPFGSMSVDVTFEDAVNKKDGKEMKVTRTIQPPPHLATMPKMTQTTTVKAAMDDYDMLFSHKDPNEPIRPKIPGQSEAIIPNVQTWSELFNETVPWPYVLQAPYVGVGEPIASGGVSTTHIPVKEEPRKARVTRSEAHVDQYIKRDKSIAVQAQRQLIQGTVCNLLH